MPRDDVIEMGKHIDSSFKRGVAKVVILNYLRKQKAHPYAILTALKRIPSPIMKDLSKSDVYNLISSLENDGFITARVMLSGAKAKKVYSVTAKGTKVARGARRVLLGHVIAMKKLLKEEFHE